MLNRALLNSIQKLGKFTIQYMRESNSGNSMSHVIRGRAHIDLHATAPNSAWTTHPVLSVDHSFIYKTPEFQVLQTFFLDVFTPQFWFASLGITFLIVLIGYIFNKLRPLSEDKPSMMLLAVFTLTSAGNLPTTKRSTFRFFLLVVGLFSFMFVSAFNLFLTSFLSTQTAILPFQTVDEIAEDGTYSICMNPVSALSLRFKDIKWDGIINKENCPKPEQYLSQGGFNVLKYACENKLVMVTTGLSKK